LQELLDQVMALGAEERERCRVQNYLRAVVRDRDGGQDMVPLVG